MSMIKMFSQRAFAAIFIFFFSSFCNFSYSSLIRKVAILDVTQRNAETNDAELFSLKYVLKTSGLNFVVTSNVDTAKKYAVIMISSKTETNTFTVPEKDSLIKYVNLGGVMFSPYVRDPYLYTAFGLNGGSNSSTNYKIKFEPILNEPAFRWLDDTMETTVSLGSISFTSVVNTRNYSVATASILAKYDNGNIAITRNEYGQGKAYSLGFTYKNMFLLNQQNRDYTANRSYSNDFEPSSDAILLFLKAAILSHVPFLPHLHTSLYDSKSTVMITHDVDATTSFDTMKYYSDYEKGINLLSTYLITTHYVNDGALSDFYNAINIPKVHYVKNQGHILASHSVGHFPDFNNEAIFPLGVLGNTSSNYQPFNQGNANPTTNGSVLGETEVSRNLLNAEFSTQIKTFRPGYLCFNKYMINALDSLGYRYSSTYAANDVLCNFPYLSKKNNASEGATSKVWEIPMTISDVISSNPISPSNWPQRVQKWLDVSNRNKRNYAPTVLLIHPNRIFKLLAEQNYIAGLSNDYLVTNLEEYGDFWIGRDSIRYNSSLNSGTLTIQIPNQSLPLSNNISFIVNNGKLLSKIEVRDGNNNLLNFLSSDWDGNDKILYQKAHPVVNLSENFIYNKQSEVRVFPNPCREISYIEITSGYKQCNIILYDVNGKIMEQICSENISLIPIKNHGYNGFYFASVIADEKQIAVLKILFN